MSDWSNERRRWTQREKTDQYERPQLDITWMLDAACRYMSLEMWFPNPGDSKTAKAARAVCDECLVRSECLNHAIEANEERGIWGGLSERQRKAMRDARARRARSAS